MEARPDLETALPATRVLVIDDRRDRRELMAYVVELCGDDVAVTGYADGPSAAVSAVERLGATVAVIEMRLPTALETIAALRTENPDIPIVVCSFLDDGATRLLALGHGADVFLSKPVSPRDLGAHLRAPRPSETSDVVPDGKPSGPYVARKELGPHTDGGRVGSAAGRISSLPEADGLKVRAADSLLLLRSSEAPLL